MNGVFTIYNSDRRTSVYMQSGSTIAPGNSVGTVTVDWTTGGNGPSAGENDYSLWMQDGSTYDWEVGAANATDTIHLVRGRLYVDDMTLNIIDAGGSPGVSDQLPVFTYGSGVTVDLVGFLDDFVLPAGWSGTPSLVDGGYDAMAGYGTVYLTGLSSGGGGGTDYATWAGGFGGLSDPTVSLDFDDGGLASGIEYVLGGDPTDGSDDAGLAPTVSDDGTNLTFTFTRDQDSIVAGTAVTIEVGTDLATWPDSYAVPDVATVGPPVTVTDNLDGTDTITLTVPKSPDTKKFARLKVVITP